MADVPLPQQRPYSGQPYEEALQRALLKQQARAEQTGAQANLIEQQRKAEESKARRRRQQRRGLTPARTGETSRHARFSPVLSLFSGSAQLRRA
jgi:hypothetical protein